MLVAKQALAPEVADVIELFHRFSSRLMNRFRSDIYACQPSDFADLRNLLLGHKEEQDARLRKRELLYRIEGDIEADVVYDSTSLVVRHIKNKNASVHYGLGTKWCIAMLREGYFEDYETNNATFFFFERRVPKGDEYDKVALMIPRESETETTCAFTALDRQVDMLTLAKIHGPDVFDIFRDIYNRSERYPGSATSLVYRGLATPEQLEAAFAIVVKGGLTPYETKSLLESVCCNDAAPWSLLEQVARRASELIAAAWTLENRTEDDEPPMFRRRRRAASGFVGSESKEMIRIVTAALAIHPNTPSEEREKLVKLLKRFRINVDLITRSQNRNGRVRVEFETPFGRGRRRRRGYRRRYRRPRTVKTLLGEAQKFERAAARKRKSAETLQRKLAEKKKRAEARAKKKSATKRAKKKR